VIVPDGFVRGFFDVEDSLGVSGKGRLLAVGLVGGELTKAGNVDEELPAESVCCWLGDGGVTMDKGGVVEDASGKCCWTEI
jgi:hypothetical protein